MAIIPRRIEGSFDKALFDFVAAREGFVPRVYSDPRGMPTLGLGYAMLDTTPGWPPRDSLEGTLAVAGIRLTPQDRSRLTSVGEALSRQDVAAAQKLVTPWIPGEDPQARNDFSFLVTRAQAQMLFELTRPDIESMLTRKLGREVTRALAGSQEMIALFSMAYSNPALIGPKLCEALQKGAREKAWFEIRFGSNRRRHLRLQQRRDQEAAMFGLINDLPSPVERAALVILLSTQQPSIKRYLEELGLARDEVKANVAALWQSAGLPVPPCALPYAIQPPAGTDADRAAACNDDVQAEAPCGPRSHSDASALLDC